MRLTIRCVLCLLVALTIFSASPANAQYRRFRAENRATGETWHVEFGVGLWQPPPDIVVSSESLPGILGSDISAQDDLGLQKKWLKEYSLVLRPAKKHKFRVGYIPIAYSADTVLKRKIIFNGQAYEFGIPINSSIQWNTWRFGYEYDFIYRDRGFLGVILEAKYTDASVTIKNPFTTEFTKARAPIPTIGGIARVYPVANISLTGEVTGLKLPTGVDALKGYDGKYLDINIYGTVNFTNYVAVQGGYRSITVSYRKDSDRGDLVLQGPYVMAVVRY
ncbi:MAG TPA: hypothetical protein VF332_10325 [Vicinamibacterales bacterium]